MGDKRIILKPGKEKTVLQRHPWIFSGAINKVLGEWEPGEPGALHDHKDQFIAWVSFNPTSRIAARIWSWEREVPITGDLLKTRIESAISFRKNLGIEKQTTAYRLIHGESDGLPGFIVDRYNDWLVVQLLTAGSEYWRNEFIASLIECTKIDQIYERSDVDVRKLEGLPEIKGMVRGNHSPGEFTIDENEIRYLVNISEGQKTGFYLDQRINRQLIKDFSVNKDVLNCFCYSGGFTLNVNAGGCNSCLSIDSSAFALDTLKRNLDLNGFQLKSNQVKEGDVFKELRTLRDQGKSFDVIILDPPKFAPTISQAEKASRGYKDINLLAFKLLKSGGVLFTFSCSGGISTDLFQKIVTGAALDAGVDARIIQHLEQSPDHPVLLSFPEGRYLKGMICQII
jgi:23S rRNA (cytosine1962-C5)-methyltransferase